MIKRYYDNLINQLLEPNKVLVIYGPRRVGKTTMIENFMKKVPRRLKIYKSTGENAELKDVLESQNFSRMIPFFQDYNIIFIDEAQKIENIGLGLKIIVDQIPNKKIIATGSSSFALSNKVGEPLVGRQTILKLYPISMLELKKEYGGAYPIENIDNLLVYGSYPEVITSNTFKKKKEFLNQIRDSYLFKDILELENVKSSKKIHDLLRLISFQIGKEVSLQELGSRLGLSKNTVERYLDLLEKSFVLINLRGFSRNLRKEITKTSRYYFYDNGVRNAVIGDFRPISQRNDIGELWENYIFTERLKKQEYHNIYTNNYFWRTWDQKEIDLVEEREGKLYGYEFKYSKEKFIQPKLFLETYPEAEVKLINKNNYLDFIT